MLEITPIIYKWLPFLGCSGVLFCSITNIFNKEDLTIHMISAIVSFISLSIWVLLMNYKCLLPLIICSVSGK